MSQSSIQRPIANVGFSRLEGSSEEGCQEPTRDILAQKNLKTLFMSEAYGILRSSVKKSVATDEDDMAVLLKIFEEDLVDRLEQLRNEELKELGCTSCQQTLREPVTLTCGHSVCKKCLHNLPKCHVCNTEITSATSLSINILLSTILKKYEMYGPAFRALADGYISSMPNKKLRNVILNYSSFLAADTSQSEVMQKFASKHRLASASMRKEIFSRSFPKRKRESVSRVCPSDCKKLATAANRVHAKGQRVNEQTSAVDSEAEHFSIAPAEAITPMHDHTDLISASDFECCLCFSLYHEPVCAPCGHSFCKECLERTIDYNSQCPLCRVNIDRVSFDSKTWRPSVDVATQAIIRRYFRKEYEERMQQHQAKIQNLKSSLPIFVCTVAFPSVTCLLHVYEARYRLMLRRILDIHDKEFGMCMPSSDKFQEVGTILRVRTVCCLPDGRSVVDGVGMRRFRVENCKSCDGYNTAQVKYIADDVVCDPRKIAELNMLIDMVYDQSKEWLRTVDAKLKQQIFNHFGKLPDKEYKQGANGPDWAWWIIAVLPLEDKAKLTLLSKCNLGERLRIIQKILKRLKNGA